MSFKSRARKRAIKAAKRANRSQTASRYYLTIVSRKSRCKQCRGVLTAECVYRHEPREILCLPCSDERGLKPRPSLKWERARAKAL